MIKKKRGFLLPVSKHQPAAPNGNEGFDAAVLQDHQRTKIIKQNDSRAADPNRSFGLLQRLTLFSCKAFLVNYMDFIIFEWSNWKKSEWRITSLILHFMGESFSIISWCEKKLPFLKKIGKKSLDLTRLLFHKWKTSIGHDLQVTSNPVVIHFSALFLN